MSRLNWERSKPQKPKRPKVETVKVHPNSMAAKKWGRKTWERRS